MVNASMKPKILLIMLLPLLLLGSCSKQRKLSSKYSNSKSPYVKEQTQTESKPEVKPEDLSNLVIREEKVRVVEQKEPETVYKYYVILGSFKVIENARKFKDDIIKEKFIPVILENENGLYRVSVNAFNDEMQARERISQIRKQYEKYNDVWLLVRKQ